MAHNNIIFGRLLRLVSRYEVCETGVRSYVGLPKVGAYGLTKHNNSRYSVVILYTIYLKNGSALFEIHIFELLTIMR